MKPEDIRERINHILYRTELKCLGAYEFTTDYMKPAIPSENLILMVHDGSVRVRIDDEGPEYTVAAGDVLQARQFTPLTFEPDPRTPFRFSSVHFFCSVLGGINFYDLVSVPQVVYSVDQPVFGFFFDRAVEMYREKPAGWWRSLDHCVFELLVELLRKTESGIRDTICFAATDERMEIVLEYLSERFTDPELRLQEIAEKACVSQVYLRKLFNRYLGHSPALFIQKRRIEYAATLLRQTPHSIQSIAEKSGFGDLAHFYRAFKKWAGMSPREYRHPWL